MKHQNMKLLLTAFTFILFACNQNKPAVQQQPPVPKALEEKSSSDYELISKSRSYNNLIEDLYTEILETNAALQELEKEFNTIDNKVIDSLKTFTQYNDKNNSYYNAAKEYTASISDSVLKKQMEELVKKSEETYRKIVTNHEQLIKKKGELASHLKNLHTVLMLSVTLPVMENYQREKLPAIKPLHSINSQYAALIQKTDTIIKKK
jgi:bacterioferritin (cytochrome b1)